jgi:hypothetical protein
VNTTTLRRITSELIALLVDKKYDDLERITRGRRLSSKAIRFTIAQYGRHLVMPPDEQFDELDCVPVRDSAPPAYGIRFDLWTAEEGRSDLTLEFTVHGTDESHDVEIDDLHVL